ncbi:MAG: hypothetical protein F6K00_34360 [Leptolyngbya sp. SIOISBB]|nr:hypothetical protein [Leptolyngbya sp. SIOISBB]
MSNMDNAYLVLIETSGNQNYIFSTNKLRENVGASELTYQAGTKWILEAVGVINDEEILRIWKNSARVRKLLRDSQKNPSIEDETLAKPVEVITAASGKAFLLTREEAKAQEIIQSVTRKALVSAPGLDVSGVYVKIDDWQADGSLAKAVVQVYKQFERARSRRPSPENRFLRLPIVSSCAISGLPATKLEKIGTQKVAISQVSVSKRSKAKAAKDRLTELDPRLKAQIDQLLSDDDIEEEKRSWLAIVHADGNGLGQIFLNFENYIGDDKSNRNYIEQYRKFSLALDECTEAAFKKALNVFPKESDKKSRELAPIVPLIIGGDDLTVVCDGHYALEFTKIFLREFETQTENHDGIRAIAEAAFGVPRLSACAGVAVVKRHFPFSVAYELAEKLIQSAKEVKKKVTQKKDENTPFPCSAIDFHILYDTSNVNLGDIRDRLKPETNVQLFHRPYVVTNIECLKEADGYLWAEAHRWSLLSDRIKCLKNAQSNQLNKAPVSSSQSHALRTALLIDKKSADSQYQLIQQRYDLKPFKESEDSLFHLTNDGTHETSFLDALDAMEFFKNAETDNESEPEVAG